MLRLHGQFFTRDCTFNKLLRCDHTEKFQPGYTVRWQNLLLEKLPDYSEFLIFLQFLEDVALPVQDKLHTEICTCKGNAIISCNCIAIVSKNYACVAAALDIEKIF